VRSIFSIHSLQFRIIAAFLAALITTFGAQGLLIWNQIDVGQNLDVVAKGYLPLSNISTRLEQAHQRIQRDVDRLASDTARPGVGDVSSTVINIDVFTRELRTGVTVLEATRSIQPSAEELAVLTLVESHFRKIQTLANRYESQSTTFVQTAEQGSPSTDPDALTPLRRTAKDLNQEIGLLNRLVDNRINRLTQSTQQTQTRSISVAVGLAVVALAFSFILILAVVFAIRPIRNLTEQVQKLTGGDFSGQVEVRGGDEVAALATEFNRMVQALKVRDKTLVQRADQLNRLSRYLTSVLDGMEESLMVVEDNRVTLANRAANQVWGARRDAPPPKLIGEQMKSSTLNQIQGPKDTLHAVRFGPFGDNGTLIISADVTQQVQTQQRLAQSQRLALVGKMLAQITHEIRNPLNALSLNAELLSDELTDLDPQKDTEAWPMLGIIISEIERLTELSGHYLQMARRPRAELVPQNPRDIIHEVAHLIHPELKRNGFELHLHCEDIHNLDVDGSQLRQALLNIIRNAMEAGGNEATVSTHANGSWCHISIEDNGPGMTEEQIVHAVDPFWSTKAQGTGLGLAITQQIMEEHGGKLQVSSKENIGTTVVLILPYRQIAHQGSK